MLAYLLALVVAAGSLVFYLAAFFLPEIHRRQDFVWSGVGLFYALVLWSCAGRITGAVLLGQMASVALLGGLAWQTLALRREMTPVAVRTAATWQDAEQWLESSWAKLQGYFQGQSLTAALGRIIQDLLRASDALRQRIAGPRGQSMAVKTTNQSAAEMPSTSPWQGLRVQIATLTSWVSKPFQNFRKPKPKRAVIDIPPREPSIPRSPTPEAVASEPAEHSQAAVSEQAIDQDGATNPDETEPTETPETETPFAEAAAAEAPVSPDVDVESGNEPLDEVTNWDDE